VLPALKERGQQLLFFKQKQLEKLLPRKNDKPRQENYDNMNNQ